jgi:hypothetical protein
MAVVTSLALGGCQTAVDFSTWAQGYNKAVETTQNEAILLNMVRAAYNLPLHFTAVSVVRGNGAASAGISALYPFGYKPDVSTSPNAVLPYLAVTGGFNFDMVSLDNSEFTQGLLVPISPTTVNAYVNQGIPREVVFNLLIERIVVTDGAQTTMYTNDPTRADYDRFVAMLRDLLAAGFTTEHETISTPVGPPLGTAEASDIDKLATATKAGLTLERLTPASGAAPQYQLMRSEAGARFCFQSEPGRRAAVPDALLCRTARKKGPSTASADGGAALPHPVSAGASLTVYTRSTRDVFNYLGDVIYMQNEEAAKPVRFGMQTAEAAEFNYMQRGNALLTVVKNQTHLDDLVSISFRGDTYSIPKDGQGHSATVLTIVTQILNLSTSINLIPATSAVLVR